MPSGGGGRGGGSRRYLPRFFVREFEARSSAAPSPGPAAGDLVRLVPEDARHAAAVLRARPGDRCEIVVLSPGGEGRLFNASFSDLSGDALVLLDEVVEVPPPRVRLTLVQAVAQAGRLDAVVEKGTEVGVDEFFFVAADGSPRLTGDRAQKKLQRWRRIAVEAAKQSKQMAVPTVELVDRTAAVERLEALGTRSLVLEPSAGHALGSVLPGVVASARGRGSGLLRVALWVGPEGGWSEEELVELARVGEPVALGRRVLRTETAGPVAAALVRFTLRDW